MKSEIISQSMNKPHLHIHTLRILIFLFTIACFDPAAIQADILHPEDILEEKLRELDHIMERRDTYYMAHEHKIDSLKRIAAKVARTKDDRRLFDITHELYTAYRSFQNDSARAYNNREQEIAKRIGDKNLIARAQIDNLFTYMSRGDFTSAVDVLKNTDLTGVSDSLKADFYVQGVRLYSDLSNFTSGRWEDKYAILSRAYSDTVLKYAPKGSYDAQFAYNFLDGYKINVDNRISNYESMIRRNDISPQLKAMLHSMLGDTYIAKGETAIGLAHKAESAIIDIQQSTRETTSKHFLAYSLYESGDIDRASRYIHAALEDAEAYNAPQRKSEIGRVLSLIEATRYKSVNGQRTTLISLLVVALVFFLIAVAALLYILKQNKKLKSSKDTIENKNRQIIAANEELRSLNDKLTSLNSKLNEDLKIKEEYIGYGFYLNSEYIEKIEELYKLVNRKVTVGQANDLKTLLRLSDIKMEKDKMLREFDEIFLRLFPTFIEQYKKLFPADDTTHDDVQEGILTPEMRIFALIRLGITDNAQIARFLNYSINTINTYKTKAKKRSVLANNEFEESIMQIKSE